jgi:phage gp29-like protein
MADTLINRTLTQGDLATRIRAMDFSAIGTLLPNPDPILKEAGRDIATYRAIARDSHVGACIRRRKAAVKSLQWSLDRGRSPSRVAKAVQAVFDRLDLERITGQLLEATLYGYQPMEITWQNSTDGILPLDVQAKPPEWFCFDTENQLRLKTWAAPVYGELLPDQKFLLPRQDPTYQNPYGLPDLSLCYWPTVFKKGGLRFWLTFAEKFGSAFAAGKLPRGASEAERTAMLDSLDALIQDGVAVIPDDGSVELVEMAGKSASADLYERLVMYCRSEISIVLTGTNQTVEASTNRASAVAGKDVADDLRDGDAEMCTAALNQLIRWMVELNWPGAEAPVFSFWDQEAQDQLRARRDKSNYDAGARFTNAYWMRSYGYQEGDLQPEAGAAPAAAPPGGSATPAAFAEAVAQTADPLSAQTDTLSSAAAPAWAELLRQVETLVANARSLPALQDAMTAAYGDLATDDLVKLMAAAFALAELKGMDAARTEGRAHA